MGKRAVRSLSRERRQAQIERVRVALDAYVEALDPLIRRVIFQPETLTLEEWSVAFFKRQPECSAARFEYERLAIQVPVEWRRYSRGRDRAFINLAELRMLGHGRRPGAPRKALGSTEHVAVAKCVEEIAVRLQKGWELCRARKNAGGIDSDDDVIHGELKALDLTPMEQLAILQKKTLQGAAVFVVARQLQKSQRTIWSSIRRARRNPPPQQP